MSNNTIQGPIGIFDSGYGGLTILKEICKALPEYNYLYLGDNARAPYGTRSFDLVYKFTLESVKYLFEQGCRLVILACNTASAKALRTIQQHDLPEIDPSRRVLGVIRPTVEMLGSVSKSGHIGIFATPGTIQSESYDMEINKLYPHFITVGHACPMWVPLIENGETDNAGTDYFVKKEVEKLLHKDSEIDTIILGCTHYPILYNTIRKFVPDEIKLITQGEIVANSLTSYLKRHPELETRVRKNTNNGFANDQNSVNASNESHSFNNCKFLTTENSIKFSQMAELFLGTSVTAHSIEF